MCGLQGTQNHQIFYSAGMPQIQRGTDFFDFFNNVYDFKKK